MFCGTNTEQLTRDHIPPKGLFPPLRRENLITVPSCLNCNNSSSSNDNYLIEMFSMCHGICEQPEFSPLWEKQLRGFKRPQSQQRVKFLQEKIRLFDVQSPDGLTVEKLPAFPLDRKKIETSIKKIVIGLFFHHKGIKLPDEYDVLCFPKGFMEDPNIWFKDPTLIEIRKHLNKEKCHNLGKGVLRYKYFATEEDKNTTIWVLMFFKQIEFIVFTSQKTLFTNLKVKN